MSKNRFTDALFFFMITAMVLCVYSLMMTTRASADWHTWYSENWLYAIEATISTPNSLPFTVPVLNINYQGQSHSVTTQGPYYMQVGWLFEPYYYSASQANMTLLQQLAHYQFTDSVRCCARLRKAVKMAFPKAKIATTGCS
jgi:hypothetical protein